VGCGFATCGLRMNTQSRTFLFNVVGRVGWLVSFCARFFIPHPSSLIPFQFVPVEVEGEHGALEDVGHFATVVGEVFGGVADIRVWLSQFIQPVFSLDYSG